MAGNIDSAVCLDSIAKINSAIQSNLGYPDTFVQAFFPGCRISELVQISEIVVLRLCWLFGIFKKLVLTA